MKRPKWEYYVVEVNRDVANDDLTGIFDEEGAAGWAMVNFLERHGHHVAIYTRPLATDDDEDDDE